MFIINYLHPSKSPHFVIFQVQLKAQTLSYDSETSNKPSEKWKAPTINFCNNGKLLLAKIYSWVVKNIKFTKVYTWKWANFES